MRKRKVNILISVFLSVNRHEVDDVGGMGDE